MKPKQILLFSFSLLLVSLLPTKVYGNDSLQKIGNDNQCSLQINNSPGTNITCNITLPPENDPPQVFPENGEKPESTPLPYGEKPKPTPLPYGTNGGNFWNNLKL